MHKRKVFHISPAYKMRPHGIQELAFPFLTRCLSRAVALLLVMLFSCPLSAKGDSKFTLVIDAGHGGNDAGAVGAVSKEKNINLSVALLFGKYVENNCPDVKVIYTRTTDKFVTLQGRADIANRAKADLFVSVHTNAVAKGKTVKGFEVYTLGMHRASDNLDVAKRENSVITLEAGYKSRYQGFDPNSSESYIMFEYMQDKNMENSVKFAKLVQTNVCSGASRIDKGVHQAGFLVLRETSMPSCLIELGFISTPEEERQLNDKSVQDKIARGIFNAFQSYRGSSQQTGPYAAPAQETAAATQNSGNAETVPPADNSDTPTFKVQILVTSRTLTADDPAFKGLSPVECYMEAGLYKYTYGSSSDYNEIYNLRKEITDKFPEAFIIAFKGNGKVNVNEAVNEWKKKK